MLSIARRRRIIRFFKRLSERATVPVLAVVAALLFWLWLQISVIILQSVQYDAATAATLGDTFGAVNSLFSAMAFVGIIATIILQSRELRQQSKELKLQREQLALQREELRLTRKEVEKTADAQQSTAKSQERSAEALKLQAEASFQSAYLNALTSLRAAYPMPTAASESFEITAHAKIASTLESIVVGLSSKVHSEESWSSWRERELSVIEELQRHLVPLKTLVRSLVPKRLAEYQSEFHCLLRLRKYLHSALHELRGYLQADGFDLQTLYSLYSLLESDLPNESDIHRSEDALDTLASNVCARLDDWLAKRR